MPAENRCLEGQELSRRFDKMSANKFVLFLRRRIMYTRAQTDSRRHAGIHTRTEPPMLQLDMIYKCVQGSLVKSSRPVNTQSHDTSTLKAQPCSHLPLCSYAQRPSIYPIYPFLCPCICPLFRIQT